ncbi:MAG: aspartate kinase, partial [Pseudonocardiales bacterium]|nr:aspartate kinase [Pseudonocardiales bacterium]
MGENKHGARAARAVASPVAPLVWKFGGTSVADHARLRAVAERMVAAQRSGRGVVAILSAMGSSTDELAEMAYKMSARPPLHLRSSFSTEEGTWIRRRGGRARGHRVLGRRGRRAPVPRDPLRGQGRRHR